MNHFIIKLLSNIKNKDSNSGNGNKLVKKYD